MRDDDDEDEVGHNILERGKIPFANRREWKCIHAVWSYLIMSQTNSEANEHFPMVSM